MCKFAVVAVFLACGGDKPADRPRPADPPKAAPKPGDAPKPAPPPMTDAGSCTVTISGAVSAKITSTGGTSKAVSGYWFAEGDKANLMFPGGTIGLIINCGDPNGAISILSRPKVTKDTVPFGPRKYTIDKKLATGELHAIGTVGKTSLLSPVGTVEITAFDNKHIAGTFQLTATTLPGKGEATLEGTFDYRCLDFSGCAK